ncbi:MAG: DoxX family protein [Stellaceae bacterium]|jgi:putative oxidoreductase
MDIRSTNSIQRRAPIWRELPTDLISGSPIARWAPVPLRLIVGYGFMEHGFAKLARGPDAFPAILQALGVPAPHLMGWLTILVEIAGGLAVLLGALMPLASIPMAAVLLVAIFTVHLPYGFSSIKLQAVTAAGAQFGPPGFETDLLYLACLAALVLGGSGPLSIEGLLAKRRDVARPSSHAGVVGRAPGEREELIEPGKKPSMASIETSSIGCSICHPATLTPKPSATQLQTQSGGPASCERLS